MDAHGILYHYIPMKGCSFISLGYSTFSKENQYKNKYSVNLDVHAWMQIYNK